MRVPFVFDGDKAAASLNPSADAINLFPGADKAQPDLDRGGFVTEVCGAVRPRPAPSRPLSLLSGAAPGTSQCAWLVAETAEVCCIR